MEEEGDFKLLTVDQWNEWWKKDYESSKTKVKVDNSTEACEHDDTFGQPNPLLRKNLKSLFPNSEIKRVFVPLCGNSPDMKWLIDNGYEVVGIECSEHAILKFFEENSIEFEISVSARDPGYRVFKGKNSSVVIYQGDFFKFNSDITDGKFDAVWDTASLNTIDLATRKQYVETMISLMSENAKYLLSAMYFGPLRTWKNNPFDISDADMTSLFDKQFSYEKIDEDDGEFGLERIFLIAFK